MHRWRAALSSTLPSITRGTYDVSCGTNDISARLNRPLDRNPCGIRRSRLASTHSSAGSTWRAGPLPIVPWQIQPGKTARAKAFQDVAAESWECIGIDPLPAVATDGLERHDRMLRHKRIDATRSRR